MSKRNPIVTAALAAMVIACSLRPVTTVADTQTLLNAPAWQLDYEVTFSSTFEWTQPLQHGTANYSASMQGVFDASLLLDLRSAGPGLSMIKSTMAPADGQQPSTAEQQKIMMDLVMRTETMANWMPAGPAIDDNAPYEQQQAAMMAAMEATKATAHLNYLFVTRSVGLVNETGSVFDEVTRKTLNGTGKVTVATNLNFEVDAQNHHYSLTLAHEFDDQTGNLAEEVTIDTVKFKGEPAAETRNQREVKLAYPSSITIDDPGFLLGQILFIEGDFDPSAEKITGEQTIRAHFVESNTTVPGTLLVKYTLTPKE